MSRGLGWKQRYLLGRLGSRSLTFAEIHREIIGPEYPEFVLKPAAERSWRRALQNLIKRDVIITTGRGRPGDPYRYHFNPLIAAIAGDDEAYNAALARIEASESATTG
jgi:hypothetical protein